VATNASRVTADAVRSFIDFNAVSSHLG